VPTGKFDEFGEALSFRGGVLEQIPPKLKALAIRICSTIIIWRDSSSAKHLRFAAKRALYSPPKAQKGGFHGWIALLR
jgi:hypothetical protein